MDYNRILKPGTIRADARALMRTIVRTELDGAGCALTDALVSALGPRKAADVLRRVLIDVAALHLVGNEHGFDAAPVRRHPHVRDEAAHWSGVKRLRAQRKQDRRAALFNAAAAAPAQRTPAPTMEHAQ